MLSRIVLRFFQTRPINVTDAISSIYQRLLNKLIGSKIESRIIKVKPNNENSDEDLLSFFVKDPDNYIFGMIV